MALRHDGTGDRTTIATGLPSWQPFTMMAWVYLIAARAGGYSNYLYFGNSGGTVGVYGFFDTDDRVLLLNTDNSYTGTSGSTISLNTWTHLALTIGATYAKCYVNGVEDISISSASFVPGIISFGGNTDYFDGRFACGKIWASELTADDIKREMWRVVPVRSGPWSWTPFTVNVIDYSGNGNVWLRNGGSTATYTYEDGPPVGWGAAPLIVGGSSGAPAGPDYGTPYDHDGVKPFSSLWRAGRM